MFSIVQTMIALSASSLMTSYSNSCHPRIDSSIRTWLILEFLRPKVAISTNCPTSQAVPPPSPPRVNAGLIKIGQDANCSAAAITSSMVLQAIALLNGKPIDSHTSLNSCLSSALSMASKSEPINSIPNSSKVPLCASSLAIFRAVCPPIPANNAQGLSISMILLIVAGSRGSIYTTSAISGSF